MAESQLLVTSRAGAVRFSVHVKPRASREKVIGVKEGALELSVTAAPVDGQANDAVVRALATALGVPRRSVTLVAGDTGRTKVIEVAGMTADQVILRLGVPA
jgi:hypothetical protein